MGKSKPVAGAIWWATYTIREPNPPYQQWLHAFLRIGEVTNGGRNRTAGAGQILVRPQGNSVPPEPLTPDLDTITND